MVIKVRTYINSPYKYDPIKNKKTKTYSCEKHEVEEQLKDIEKIFNARIITIRVYDESGNIVRYREKRN